MNTRRYIVRGIGLFLILHFSFLNSAMGQELLRVDTLQCNIIGFSAGAMMPLGGSASSGMKSGGMKDLYDGPYLDFSLEWAYKFKSGWMITFDADLWFGYNSNNLTWRAERMGDLFNSQGRLMAPNGEDGVVTMYNRGLSARPGIAKIINVLPKNPNSGILLKLSGGWFMQKTVFTQDMNESSIPQLSGDYAGLYDHLRNGMIITESVGFAYMHNHSSYINFKITFDLSQCLSWSSRPYIIDNMMGLNGKDNNTYFDLLLGMKLSWMFPLTGRTSYDYYYY